MAQQVHSGAKKFLDVVAEEPPMDTLSVQQIRDNLDQAIPLTGDGIEMVRVEDRKIAGVPVRVYTPNLTDSPQPCVIYFHGGGWTTGTLDIADTIVREIAAEAGAIGSSVDYRLAPEHPFPIAAVVSQQLRSHNPALVHQGLAYARPEQREDVRVSPALNSDLTGLPTTTVIVAEMRPIAGSG